MVPDRKAQHAGCSRQKRKETTAGAAAASRVYCPTPEIAALTDPRGLKRLTLIRASCPDQGGLDFDSVR